MSSYPAVVVAVDSTSATVEMVATGKRIVFSHAAYNALAPEARQVGVKGHISFPKAPPVFTADAADSAEVAA